MTRLMLGLATAFFVTTQPGVASSQEADNWHLGRALYRTGTDGTALTVTLASSEQPLSAADFACANCHGIDGAGKLEGRLDAPALHKSALKDRYRESDILRAISMGIGNDGRKLSTMPRFHISPTQGAALLSYLETLGTTADRDPGISESTLTLGAIVPLSGPGQMSGNVIVARLQQRLDSINDQGGIYGRRLLLKLADGAKVRNSAAQLLSHQVYAMLASQLPDEHSDSDMLWLAPLALAPTRNSASPAVYYALSGPAEHGRDMVRAIAARSTMPVIAAVVGDFPAASLAFSAAQTQAQALGIKRILRIDSAANTAHADHVLWLADARGLDAGIARLQKSGFLGDIYMSSAVTDPAAVEQVGKTTANINIAYSGPVKSGQKQAEIYTALADTAVDILIAGLERCGRVVNRAIFAEKLDSAKNIASPLGIIAVSLDPSHRRNDVTTYIGQLNSTSGLFQPTLAIRQNKIESVTITP